MGIGKRFDMSEAKCVEHESAGLVVKPSRLLTMMLTVPPTRVAAQIAQVERLGPNALTGVGRIAMHDERKSLLLAAFAVAHLVGPHTAQANRVHSFQVAWVGNQVDANRTAVDLANIGRALVILDVAAA